MFIYERAPLRDARLAAPFVRALSPPVAPLHAGKRCDATTPQLIDYWKQCCADEVLVGAR